MLLLFSKRIEMLSNIKEGVMRCLPSTHLNIFIAYPFLMVLVLITIEHECNSEVKYKNL